MSNLTEQVDLSRSIGETSAEPATAVVLDETERWVHEDDDEPEDIHARIPFSIGPKPCPEPLT
jgi:hypothetical protein